MSDHDNNNDKWEAIMWMFFAACFAATLIVGMLTGAIGHK